MKKSGLAIICVAAIALVLASCQANSKTGTTGLTSQLPVNVTDALGRQIVFNTLPSRIVIAGKANSLLLNAFFMFPEAAARIVAYESRSQNGTNFLENVDPHAVDKNVIQQDASVEQILPYQPDLVILKYYLKDTIGDALEAVAVPVFYMDMETPEKFLTEVISIGQILGNTNRAEEIVAEYRSNMDLVENSLGPLTDGQKPMVLLLQYSDKGGSVSFNVPPAEWIQTSLVTTARGIPVWLDAAQSGGWTQVTIEQIAAWNPDFIFVIYYQGDSSIVVEQLLLDQTWQSLKAYQDGGRIVGFPSDFISWDQPDTRWILGLIYLSSELHPDLMADDILMNSLYDFYAHLYDFSYAEVDELVIPILKGDLP